MNFYGVGVKLDGFGDSPRSILAECLEHNFWCMGWNIGMKPKFDDMIDKVQVGDIVVAKAFYYGSPNKYYVHAIGIVTDKNKPQNIPDEFQDKKGFSVCWIKHFNKNVCLKANNDFMPQGFMEGMPADNNRTFTIYHETSEEIIKRIIWLLKYNNEFIDGYHCDEDMNQR